MVKSSSNDEDRKIVDRCSNRSNEILFSDDGKGEEMVQTAISKCSKSVQLGNTWGLCVLYEYLMFVSFLSGKACRKRKASRVLAKHVP